MIWDGFKDISVYNTILAKTSQFVSYVRNSTIASEYFDEAEIKRLQQANATRWNSQLFMILPVVELPQKVFDKHPGVQFLAMVANFFLSWA